MFAQAAETVQAPGALESGDAEAQAFVSWLATTDRSWLVVLDNVADPADARAVAARRARRVPVTTRRRDATLSGPGRVVVRVGVFTPAEGADALSVSTAH